MKRFILLFSFMLLAICAKTQKVIQMEHENGVFKISCLVNGAKMKMIFDTGASTVSLSESMANFLHLREYEYCIEYCLRWNRYNGSDKTLEDKATCYEHLCVCYDAIKQHGEAIKWGEKAVQVNKNSITRLPWDYLNLSGAYQNIENYSEAIRYGKLAVSSQLKKLNTNSKMFLKGLYVMTT